MRFLDIKHHALHVTSRCIPLQYTKMEPDGERIRLSTDNISDYTLDFFIHFVPPRFVICQMLWNKLIICGTLCMSLVERDEIIAPRYFMSSCPIAYTACRYIYFQRHFRKKYRLRTTLEANTIKNCFFRLVNCWSG